MRILIKNGSLVLGSEILRKNLLIKDGSIESLTEKEPAADAILDVRGAFVAPGFIDIHVHGGGGHDFMEATPEAFLRATEHHLSHGTTALCPTTVSAPLPAIRKFLEAYQTAEASGLIRARMLGAHLEGPHLSTKKNGAQDARFLTLPVVSEYEALIGEFPFIKRITAAPEIPGVLDLADHLFRKGVQFSIGHSDARGSQIEEAIRHGFRSVTHLYNAMSAYGEFEGRKAAGVTEKALLEPDLYAELIGDLIHVPADLYQLAYQSKTSAKLILVTDALSPSGMPKGLFFLGEEDEGIRVDVREAAYIMGTNKLAGSLVTTDLLLKNALSLGIPLIDAVKMLTETPARLLGLEKTVGSLKKGLAADVVVFDDQGDIRHVICQGQVIK